MSKGVKKRSAWAVLLLALLIAVYACGCVEILGADDEAESGGTVTTKTTSSSQTTKTTQAAGNDDIPTGMDEELWWELYGDEYSSVTSAITPLPGMESYVEQTDPIAEEETNTSSLVAQGRPEVEAAAPFAYPIYSAHYQLTYESVGLIASIAEAPLVIDYAVDAEYDDPYYSFLVITVRDADTHEVIAEAGYGRIYSVQEEQQIIIRAPGNYHINLYGTNVDVDLRVSAGG